MVSISYLQGVNRTFGKYEFLSFKGAQWLKIFYHRPGNNKVVFENEEQLMNINEKQRFSILGELNEKYKINDKYEFLLYYPSISKFNWWRQTKLHHNDYEVEGESSHAERYENVSISMTKNHWGGLVRQTLPYNSDLCKSECTFIEGSVGIGNYYYAIGLRAQLSTVPAEVEWVNDVYLFIRIIGVNPSLFFSKFLSNQTNYLPYISILLMNS